MTSGNPLLIFSTLLTLVIVLVIIGGILYLFNPLRRAKKAIANAGKPLYTEHCKIRVNVYFFSKKECMALLSLYERFLLVEFGKKKRLIYYKYFYRHKAQPLKASWLTLDYSTNQGRESLALQTADNEKVLALITQQAGWTQRS